jgi:hypothetical protein
MALLEVSWEYSRLYWRFYRNTVAGSWKSLLPCCDRISNTISTLTLLIDKDMKTIALVSLCGNIDYFCFPHFDSPAMFCSILDCHKGGYWSVSNHGATNSNICRSGLQKMKLLPIWNNFVWFILGTVSNVLVDFPGTNVLVTRSFTECGVAQIMDYSAYITIFWY